MQTPAPFIITSTVEILDLYKQLTTLDHNSPGYDMEMIVQPSGLEDGFALHHEDILRLFTILAKLRCPKLTLSKIHIFRDGPTGPLLLPHLLEVEMRLCRGSSRLVFISTLVNRCPQLLTLSETSAEEPQVTRDDCYESMIMIDRTTTITDALSQNYGLLTFESSFITGQLDSLLAAEIGPTHGDGLQNYVKLMGTLLKRNRDGYIKCSVAIRQLFLIKRYRPDSVFRFINLDVVRLIARLVHGSRGTKIWS